MESRRVSGRVEEALSMTIRTINIPATTDLDADELTSGTVPFARLSTGTGSTQAAVGDHTHTAAAVGAAPATRTVGTTPSRLRREDAAG